MLKHRNIVKIDEEKCTGCGLCAIACAERAIQIVDGKAKLVSEIYCDGLGACIGECPEGALAIEEREAEEFDGSAVEEYIHQLEAKEEKLPCGCPGTMSRSISRESRSEDHAPSEAMPSELANWPVQLRLVHPEAPYLRGAELLLVADCVPFALADFHSRFLRGKAIVIGCPKLDNAGYYAEKLTEMLKRSSLKSLTVVHMEVPCCSGLNYIASRAIQASGKSIPTKDVTIAISGEVLAERESLMLLHR